VVSVLGILHGTRECCLSFNDAAEVCNLRDVRVERQAYTMRAFASLERDDDEQHNTRALPTAAGVFLF